MRHLVKTIVVVVYCQP